MSFIIEEMENDDRWVVKDKSTGWFFPVESKIQAETLCDKFNELESKPLDLHKDFEEWDKFIDNVIIGEKNLISLKEEYEEKAQQIIAETDFKELYGANNQKVRDNHVKKELSELTEEITDIKLKIEYGKLRISFLKRLIDMKNELIKYEGQK